MTNTQQKEGNGYNTENTSAEMLTEIVCLFQEVKRKKGSAKEKK